MNGVGQVGGQKLLDESIRLFRVEVEHALLAGAGESNMRPTTLIDGLQNATSEGSPNPWIPKFRWPNIRVDFQIALTIKVEIEADKEWCVKDQRASSAIVALHRKRALDSFRIIAQHQPKLGTRAFRSGSQIDSRDHLLDSREIQILSDELIEKRCVQSGDSP